MASSWVGVAFAAVLLKSLRCLFLSALFLRFVEPKAPVPPRIASHWRERPSFNGDHYSSESAGAPPVGRRARGARTTPSDYAQTTLLPGARSSPRLSGHTFPPSCSKTIPQRNFPSPTHQTCSLRARPACFTLSASRCAITCQSPRAASTSPKIVRRLVLRFVPRGLWDISIHQRQAYSHQHFLDTAC